MPFAQGDGALQAISINCPSCGAPVSINDRECSYCNRPILLSSFNSMDGMSATELNKYISSYRKELNDRPSDRRLNRAAALCYMKLKMYDKASEAFEKAIEDNLDDADSYFFAAISLLKGKKAFLAKRPEVDKAIEYLSATNMIAPKGIYAYFHAYIKYDYFARKSLNTVPDYRELLEEAQRLGVTDYDVKVLFDLLNVVRPTDL